MVDAVTVAVIDYGMGNRRSVQKALERAGAAAPITGDPDVLRTADALVLPGVGAFGQAMVNLRSLGLDELIRERVHAGTALLGVCLGMQLLFESSEEHGHTVGLGLLPGTVTPLQAGGLRVPHIGWNTVHFERADPLLDGLPAAGCPFYHVHSQAVRPARDELVLGSTEYGERFATIVAHEQIRGVQFHPEKSSADGLRLLGNFVAGVRAGAVAGARA
jgi:glutamine amidotransferase